MTGRADFLVDFEAALKLRLIVFSERPGKRPFQPRRRFLLRSQRWQRHGSDRAGQHESENRALHRHSTASAHAFAPRTDSEIEFGSGLVFSKMPSSGMMIRKNAK